MLNLTIVIPVKNEAANLHRCLQAIGKSFVNEVVVIDSGSSDGTQQIAQEWGATLLDFNWNGKYPKKRNWFLLHHPPVTDWVLFLDADEFLTEAFKTELKQVIEAKGYDGYWLRYSIYFMGKKMKGGYPLHKLALFRVGKALYERIDEDSWSALDMEVHEHPLVAGRVGIIKSKIDHLDYRGINHYVTKHAAYASWEAERYLSAKENPQPIRFWTWKQRIKYKLIETPLLGPLFFISSFFLLGGFLNGIRGFVFSALKMHYFIQVYCRIKELKSISKKVNPF